MQELGLQIESLRDLPRITDAADVVERILKRLKVWDPQPGTRSLLRQARTPCEPSISHFFCSVEQRLC